MGGLESIVKKLGNKTTRRRRLELMYEQALFYSLIPYSAIQALEILLNKLMDGNLKKNIAVVEGKSSASLVRRPDALNGRIRFGVGVFSKPFYLGMASANQKARVGYEINPFDTITIDRIDGAVRDNFVFKLPEGQLFDCARLSPKLYRKFSGVALLLTSNLGKAHLGGKTYNFGTSHIDDLVITFFENDNPYFFDSDGNMIFTTLPSPEVFEQRALERMFGVHHRYLSFDSNASSGIEFMESLWMSDPEFTRSRVLYTQVSLVRSVNTVGVFPLSHYQDGELVKYFYAGYHHKNQDVKISAKGPYVIIENMAGVLVNAYQLRTPGILAANTGEKFQIDGCIAVGVPAKRNHRLCLDGQTYSFSVSQVRALSEECDHKALMIHLHPEGNHYYLLVKKSDELQKYPIDCLRIRPSH